MSANTRDCYQRALRQLHAYLAGAEVTDASVAAYLGHLFERGYAAATAAMVVAAIACYCKHAAIAAPVGPLTRAALLIHVRRSKTNQEGHDADVRYLKNGCAAALAAIRPDDPDDQEPVFALSPASIGRRFSAAASAAGIEHRLTAHSGRVGLASELTARGASTTEVMRAGAWKTARMVAHYSAGATAERGAVAKYL